MDRASDNQFHKQKGSTPSFLIKTFDILQASEFQDLICWNEEGTSFIVKNQNGLAEKVLPNYFKHNNYASFVRQLNMYNFHKRKNEKGDNEFTHKYFQRENRNLLSMVRRKQKEQEEQEDERSQHQDNIDINKLKNDYQFFLNEMLGIKGKQYELQKALILIITQNDHLINENKLIWEEIKNIREVDEKRLDTLSYLLASYISNVDSKNKQFKSPPAIGQTNQQQNGLKYEAQVTSKQQQQQQEPQKGQINQQYQQPFMIQNDQQKLIEQLVKTQMQQEQYMNMVKQQMSQQSEPSILKKNCNSNTKQQSSSLPTFDMNINLQQSCQTLLQQLQSSNQAQSSQNNFFSQSDNQKQFQQFK